MKDVIKICPSILAGDFAHLAKECERVEAAGADWLHCDVMDGHFVKNITFGPQVVAAINRSTKMFLDVHLMIYTPFDYIERFVEAGADMITFHFEATEDIEDTLEFIERCGVKSAIAFNPETSPTMIPKYLQLCDMILLMTVNPGFGGQAFMPEVLDKIRFTREICNKLNIRKGGEVVADKKSTLPPFDIGVDGGINDETAKLCAEAGANIFVAGTHFFGKPNMADAIKTMRQIGEKNFNPNPQ